MHNTPGMKYGLFVDLAIYYLTAHKYFLKKYKDSELSMH